MAKSTTPPRAWKPCKPTPDFPLSFCPSGRFSKRLKGRFINFGRWANVVAGELIPVENFTEAATARMEFDRQWPYIVRGERPPVVSSCQSGNLTVRHLANEFLTFKSGRVETGELTTYALPEYRSTCASLTVAALTESLQMRTVPDEPLDDGLCFLTERGTPYVRMRPSKTQEHRHVCINAIARRFELLLKALNIEGRRGLGCYTFRHVFETSAGERKHQALFV